MKYWIIQKKIKLEQLTQKEIETFNKAKEFLDKTIEVDNEESRKRITILSLAYLFEINFKNKWCKI